MVFRTEKEILEDRISFLKKRGFKEPNFSDIYKGNFKKKDNGLITYDTMRENAQSFAEVNYFCHFSLSDFADDMLKMDRPEYAFMSFIELKPREKDTIVPLVESILNKCICSFEKKYGKKRARLLRKKYCIRTLDDTKENYCF